MLSLSIVSKEERQGEIQKLHFKQRNIQLSISTKTESRFSNLIKHSYEVQYKEKLARPSGFIKKDTAIVFISL